MPVGYYVRLAPLIAIANIEKVGPPSWDVFVTVTEVIKGDPALRGRRVRVVRSMSTAEVRIASEARGVAVLFEPEWQTNGRVLEVYHEAPQIEAVRALALIYALPAERERLIAVRDLALRKKDPILLTQLYADLSDMRERGNFPLVLDLLEQGDDAHRRKMIEVIRHIGDARAVPALLRAMKSPDRWTALQSAAVLSQQFRGAPGVTAAFREALQSKVLATTAMWYLLPYDAAVRARFEAERNAYQKASDRLQKGDEAGAAQWVPAILDDPKLVEPLVWFHADWVERYVAAHPAEADRAFRAMLPVLDRFVKSGDYIQARSAATVLRSFRRPEVVEMLLALMDRTDEQVPALFDESRRIAAYALADLGVRRPAIDALIANPPTINWVVYRLGRVPRKSSIKRLVVLLEKGEADAATVIEALTRIGGRETQLAMLPLVRSPSVTVRQSAMEVLFNTQGRRLLPMLRRLLASDQSDLRAAAARYLGRIGEPSDLKILIPMSDFWTGDRVNHYWMTLAVTEIRSRHGYDVNGPIPK